MKKAIHFEREVNLIQNEDLRMAVKSYMDECVADWFYTTGASASGKFHPKFSQGEGGLVRHTKAVVMFAEEFLRMSPYCYLKDEYKDFVIAACIVHDTAKYGLTGEMDKSVYKDHAKNAAILFENWCVEECGFQPSEFLLNAIKAHMGQWSTEREDRPFTSIDRCVHEADYMASRSFIDIPTITDEWNAIESDNEDIPF